MPAITSFSLPGLPRLLEAPKKAFRPSVAVAHVDALTRRRNTSKSNVRKRVLSDTSALLIGTGLQPMFEQGRKEGYPIFPSGVVGIHRSFSRTKGAGERIGLGRKGLRTSGRAGTGAKALLITSGGLAGQYFAVVSGGDMKPYPAMAPAARDWVHGGFHKTAQISMLSQGFGIR